MSTMTGPALLNAVIPSSSTSTAEGFTPGGPEDDARWAAVVVSNTHAVVCSVYYRRAAPEHPFPTAGEDGADAVFYLTDHAEELGIDPHRVAVSGLSAGGGVSFAVPLRLDWRKSGRSARAGSRVIGERRPA